MSIYSFNLKYDCAYILPVSVLNIVVFSGLISCNIIPKCVHSQIYTTHWINSVCLILSHHCFNPLWLLERISRRRPVNSDLIYCNIFHQVYVDKTMSVMTKTTYQVHCSVNPAANVCGKPCHNNTRFTNQSDKAVIVSWHLDAILKSVITCLMAPRVNIITPRPPSLIICIW